MSLQRCQLKAPLVLFFWFPLEQWLSHLLTQTGAGCSQWPLCPTWWHILMYRSGSQFPCKCSMRGVDFAIFHLWLHPHLQRNLSEGNSAHCFPFCLRQAVLTSFMVEGFVVPTYSMSGQSFSQTAASPTILLSKPLTWTDLFLLCSISFIVNKQNDVSHVSHQNTLSLLEA